MKTTEIAIKLKNNPVLNWNLACPNFNERETKGIITVIMVIRGKKERVSKNSWPVSISAEIIGQFWPYNTTYYRMRVLKARYIIIIIIIKIILFASRWATFGMVHLPLLHCTQLAKKWSGRKTQTRTRTCAPTIMAGDSKLHLIRSLSFSLSIQMAFSDFQGIRDRSFC